MSGKKKNFEKELVELETLVDKLESEELSLDDSLQFFEDGIKAYKSCKKYLATAEKKIKILTEELNEEEYK